ncbi:MAG: site-2 protease family protein [Clostridia bacterium]|nr:site-2 protease family protein [Clostridia bacterium]
MLTNIFSSVWTILVTIFIFGILITIHELGHYLVARAFKVGIREFSVGMGPAIHTWKCKTNKVSIRWLPIGGYVSMVGESPDDEPEPEDEGKAGLNTKPVWQRILVVLAGPLTNILFAFVVMALLVTFMPSNRIGSTIIAEFSADSVTQAAGLMPGDEIVAIDGTGVHVFNDINYLVALRGRNPLDVTVIRNGEEIVIKNVQFPESVSGGVAMGDIDFKVYAANKTFGEVLHQAFWQPVSIVKMTIESLFRAVRGEYGWAAVSGPVGVGEQIGEVISATRNFGDTIISLVMMAVLISVSLGIFNLLPIPVLDGGHILFYVIELIRGKPMKPKTEAAINTAFMILLLGFMLFVTVKDVVGLF